MALPPGEHCTYRANRTRARRYTAKDVARIYCLATAQGVSRAEITEELKYKCEVQDDGCSCEDLLKELATAQKVTSLALEIGTAAIASLKVLKKSRTLLEKLRAKKGQVDAKELEKAIQEAKDAEALQKTIEETERVLGTTLDDIIAETERVSKLIVDVPVVIKP